MENIPNASTARAKSINKGDFTNCLVLKEAITNVDYAISRGWFRITPIHVYEESAADYIKAKFSDLGYNVSVTKPEKSLNYVIMISWC